MTKWHAHVVHFVHMAKHMKMVGDPLWWRPWARPLGPPPKYGAAGKVIYARTLRVRRPSDLKSVLGFSVVGIRACGL